MIRKPESGEPLAIYLNLGPEPRDLPPGLVQGAPSFRSEVEAYGATADREKRTQRASPPGSSPSSGRSPEAGSQNRPNEPGSLSSIASTNDPLRPS